jgi:GNAT superfamily N-acetyltransferase
MRLNGSIPDRNQTTIGRSLMDLTYRPATRADLPQILTLLAHLDETGAVPMPLTVAEAIFERIARYPSYTIWLVESAGQVVGTYTLLIIDNLGHHGTPAGLVENVVVIPEARGQGIGEAMMIHARDLCHRAGCYKLALSSNAKREDAHRFYDRIGFARHGYSFLCTP